MKNYTMTAMVLAAGLSCMVSCTSLPGNISQGIENGNAHAYYEAGKHIDDCKVVKDAPMGVRALCFPFDVCMLPFNVVYVVANPSDDPFDYPSAESCFYYRTHASKNQEALKYYTKGAELGDAGCLYEMGRNYENGWGVKKDKTMALQYYNKAAALGNASAQSAAGKLHNELYAQSPDSLVGKTIYFNYANASRALSGNGGETWNTVRDSSTISSIRFSNTPNNKRNQGEGVGEGHFLSYQTMSDGGKSTTSYDYKKADAKTAKIVFPGYEWETTYTLNFETPTSGTASYHGSGEGEEWKGSGIKFNIK